jgi:predicted DsbA family dithiol-disulfide isomerase
MKKEVKKEFKFIKISTPVAIGFIIALFVTSFYSGYAWNKLRSTNGTSSSTTVTSTTASFAAQKSQKPELKFFVMSFCPYGNQMEDVLRPVFDLLKNKADITPHYIFEKIDNLDTYCKARSGDPAQCALYVQNKYFNTESECQKAIADNSKACLNASSYIKSSNGAMYASLHGRQEANQDVREICAWNQTTDKSQWWNFIGAVNKNCTAQNADSCWENQAKSAGLDTTKITECFNKEGVDLIEKEIAITTKYNVSGSPTVLINDVAFPPEAAYTQDGKGTLKVNGKVATQDRYRTPNVVKEAVCASFQKSPSECKSVLKDLDGVAPAAGGC